MKHDKKPSIRRVWKDDRGVVAILVAAGIFAFVGFGALVVDLAYLFNAKFALQAATNAAALAGAQDIGTGGTPLTTAKNYSAYTGDMNALSNITVASPTVSITCLSGWGIACSTNQTPATSANIIEVTQTATVPVFFANLFHAPPWSISATAVASPKGGAVGPFNVAFIQDTTGSMGSLSGGTTAKACAGFSSAVDCATAGIQTLLKELWPCAPGTCGTSTPTPFDEVALFVFPPVTNAGQAAVDIGCTAPVTATYYSGVANTASAATTTSTLSLTTTMSNADPLPSGDDPAFNTGSPWAVVTDAGTPTSANTTSGKTLTFPTGVITAKVTPGLTVQDMTNPSAISSGTTVSGTTGTTVTLSKNVVATVNKLDLITFGTSIPAGTGSWPWWGTGTTMSSVTLPTTAVMSASPTGADILKGDTIITAPLYQIVGFGYDFGTSDPATTLNASSNIVKVTKPGCLGTPGGLGTYYADAIGAAQSALVAVQTARIASGQPGGQNVIILLSDGAAGSNFPPSSGKDQMGPLESVNYTQQCHAAITAAQNAAAAGKTVAAAGTWVFAIYFDDGSNTCSDTTSITACSAMQKIANTPIPTAPYYFNDPTKFFSTDGGSGTCPSTANPNYSTVANIFGGGIGGALTNARLIPAACVSASPPAGC